MDFRQGLLDEIREKLRENDGTIPPKQRLENIEYINDTMEFFAAFQEWKYFHLVEDLGILPSPTVLGRILCKVDLRKDSDSEVNYNTQILEKYWERENPLYPDPEIVERVYNNVDPVRYVRRWIQQRYDLSGSPPRPLPKTRLEINKN